MGTVSTGNSEKVPEMDDDDGCITMQMYLMPHNRALKSSSKGKVDVVVYILHQKKKMAQCTKRKYSL